MAEEPMQEKPALVKRVIRQEKYCMGTDKLSGMKQWLCYSER